MSAVDADQYGYRDTRNDDGTFKRIGDKLKDADLWIIRRLGTNSSEFSALPGGCRYHAGQYIFRGCDAFFWTSASYRNADGWYRRLNYWESKVGRFYYYKETGFSVRCVKD